MNAFRSLLFLILAILVTAPAGLLVALGALLPMGARYALVAAWRAVFMALVRFVLGIRYRVLGAENIPAQPSVIVSKHQSAWETVALQDVFAPRRIVFVLKRELIRLPFLGWGLAAMRMISIDRSAGKNALAQVAEQGKDRLGKGFWVVVFPEGTRVAPGQKRRYKPGGAYLAVQAGAMVVPVAHNAGELWPRNALIKKPGLITVSIGPPIDPAGLDEEAVNARAEAWIEAEMRRISPHRYPDAQDAVAAA